MEDKVIIKNMVARPLNCIESNGYIKICLECLWGKSGPEREAKRP